MNSTSTPVMLSGNTSVSKDELKNVSRCWQERDNSCKSSRISQELKNDQFSTASLTDLSMQVNLSDEDTEDADIQDKFISDSTASLADLSMQVNLSDEAIED